MNNINFKIKDFYDFNSLSIKSLLKNIKNIKSSKIDSDFIIKNISSLNNIISNSVLFLDPNKFNNSICASI